MRLLAQPALRTLDADPRLVAGALCIQLRQVAIELGERAERWLREQLRILRLLAALGRLCIAAELWGKAQTYLEASLSFGVTRAALLDLARLAEREGKAAEAAKYFRRAGELP